MTTRLWPLAVAIACGSPTSTTPASSADTSEPATDPRCIPVNEQAFVEATGDLNTIDVALDYLDAYQNFDVERMGAMYTEDIQFIDLTSTSQVNPPFIYEGRDDVVAAIQSVVDFGYKSLNYDITRLYESGGYVVVAANTEAIVNSGSGRSRLGAEIVTVLRVVEGQIAEHRDFYDYNGVVLNDGAD